MDNDIEKCLKSEYDEFKKKCIKVVDRLIKEANDELIEIGLSVIFDKDYEFENHEDWVAALNIEDQTDAHEMLVGFDIEKFYDFLCEHEMENNNEEIESQLKVSLWHEIGHGIINFLEDEEIKIPFDEDEEDICEEYGRFKIKEYTGQTISKLDNFLKAHKNQGE